MSSKWKISIIVLGEMGVGKTSLLLRFNKGKFSAYNASTSINRYFKDIHVADTDIQLELYDTGGHDRFRDIVRANYKKVDGVLLIYDVTDVSSFYKLSSWLDEVRSANESATTIIVGNKSDISDTKTVSRTMVKQYAVKENLEYYESSAKTGENVKQVFERIALKILEAKNVILPSTHSPESQNHPVQPVDMPDSTTDLPSPPQSTNNPATLPQPLEVTGTNTNNPSEKSMTTTNNPSERSMSTTNNPSERSTSTTNNTSEEPSTTDSSTQPPVNQPVQAVSSANEEEDREEADWCFPDLDYLNSRKQTQTSAGSSSKDDLPPIVPLPDDIIVLHIEKCMKYVNGKLMKKKTTGCCY